MPKELYLYSGIYDYTAESIISSIEENAGEDITIRMNTPGGSVFSGWGIIAKMKEHTGKVHAKVDGIVASMGSMILAYAGSSEALDVSKIMIHRADMWISKPEDQTFLNMINKDFRAKLEKKIDVEKLKELKNVSMDDIFNPESRIDVWLTAKEAKSIGLIDKVVKLDPVQISAITNLMQIAASMDINNPPKQVQNSNSNKMTIEEFKAANPEAYAQIVALGVSAEKDRVGAWLAYNKIDPEAVEKGIKEGKTLSQTESAEFAVKALSGKTLETIVAENAAEVKTDASVTATAKTEKEKAIAEFESALDARLGISVVK